MHGGFPSEYTPEVMYDVNAQLDRREQIVVDYARCLSGEPGQDVGDNERRKIITNGMVGDNYGHQSMQINR